MPALFITATGTDVGKTFVTTGLIRALRQHGRKVTALKPIGTGIDAENFAASDAALLLEACGRGVDLDAIAAISPWRFTRAALAGYGSGRGRQDDRRFGCTAFLHQRDGRGRGRIAHRGHRRPHGAA